MKSRLKFIVVVLTIWMILFATSFFIGKKLFIVDFERLERNNAFEASQRISRSVISELHYVDLLNGEASNWDEAYGYVENPKSDFVTDNYPEDYFVDNHLNEVLIMNLSGKVLWSAGYDITKNKFYPISPVVLDYFKQNALALIKYKKKYNDLGQNEQGISGFMRQPTQDYVSYYSINYIYDTKGLEDPIGLLIYGKTLTPEFIKEIGQKMGYKIVIQDLDTFGTTPARKNAIDKIVKNHGPHLEPIDSNTLSVYRIFNSFDFKPMGLFRIDLPRELHKSTQRAVLLNQTLLFSISMIGLLLISGLLFLLFRKQEKITRSFERFVPYNFIELLNKSDILDVGLGDQLKQNIAVLFLDIRNFTTISESLTPQGNFDFVNSVLKELSPIVVEYQGFINKYIGDCIMALFPGESCSDDAINSGLAILKKLTILNKNKAWVLASQEVHVGIGINTGELMLGIVGEKNRLEGTVIGDVVNIASRVESMTKTYEQSMMITQETYESLKRPERYDFTDLGDVFLKGKAIPVRLYGVQEKQGSEGTNQ